MPELPEVESARAVIERAALGRTITDVDDSDTYECRPHRPGEIRRAPDAVTPFCDGDVELEQCVTLDDCGVRAVGRPDRRPSHGAMLSHRGGSISGP